MKILTLPHGDSAQPVSTFLQSLNHGDIVCLSVRTDWKHWLPVNNGVLLECSPGVLLNQAWVEDPKPFPSEHEVKSSALVNPTLGGDAVPKLNDDKRLPVRFEYNQFVGHPYGAMFETDYGVLLIIDRRKFDKKFK